MANADTVLAGSTSATNVTLRNADDGGLDILTGATPTRIGKLTTAGALTITGDASVASLNGGQLAGFRNKIIGGDFTTAPWQRGTSFTAPGVSAYTADRFVVNFVNDGVCNILKTADAPTAAEAGVYTQHCLHHDVTTLDATIAAGQYYLISQNIEGLNAASMGFGQAGTRNITLSFWVKSTKTGIFCVSLVNSAANRSYVAEYTVLVTNTWEKKTITIAVDTSGTWLYDTGVGLGVRWAIAAGTTFHTTAGAWAAGNFFSTVNQVNGLDSASNDFKLALIQLEAGSTATPFESTDVGNVLRQCQRYYFRNKASAGGEILAFSGQAYATTATVAYVVFPVTMRTEVTALEQSGTAGDYQVYDAAWNAVALTSVPAFSTGNTFGAVIGTTISGGGLVAGNASALRSTNSSAYVGFSAEL